MNEDVGEMSQNSMMRSRGRETAIPFERRKVLLRIAEEIAEEILKNTPTVPERQLLWNTVSMLIDR